MVESKKSWRILHKRQLWSVLRPIETSVVDTYNEVSAAMAPTVPHESEVQVPLKHDFSEIF